MKVEFQYLLQCPLLFLAVLPSSFSFLLGNPIFFLKTQIKILDNTQNPKGSDFCKSGWERERERVRIRSGEVQFKPIFLAWSLRRWVQSEPLLHRLGCFFLLRCWSLRCFFFFSLLLLLLLLLSSSLLILRWC